MHSDEIGFGDNYIFGYGSLISNDSRARTGETGKPVAVTVSDIARSWSVPVPSCQFTAVGAVEQAGSYCNGVVFPVTPESLQRFDEREIGYTRILLAAERFNPRLKFSNEAQIWTYVGTSRAQPTPQLPIAQSYLDVVIDGCRHYGHDFIEAFFETTLLWNHIVDDRHEPRCSRHLKSSEHIKLCDAILAKYAPIQLNRRVRSAQNTEEELLGSK